MTGQKVHDELEDFYAAFGENHQERRAQLLAELAARNGVVASAPQPAGDTVVTSAPRSAGFNIRRRGWLAVAAGLLALIALPAILRQGGTQSAYGLEQVRDRLAALDSLYLKGWMYQEITTADGERKVEQFPTEQYAARPDKLAQVSYGFSDKGGAEPTIIRRSFMATDGSRSIAILHHDKRALVSSNVDLFETELRVENLLQSRLPEQVLSGAPEDYQRRGIETIDGELCDVYEMTQGEAAFGTMLFRVWLNPRIGLPARVGFYRVDEEGVEHPVVVQDVQVNVAPPAHLFSFAAPEGYELVTVEREAAREHPALSPKGSGGSNSTWFSAWHALAIDDRAVLIAWSQYDDGAENRTWFARYPQFMLLGASGTRACYEELLATNERGDYRWRWSLITPADGEPVGRDALQLVVRSRRMRSGQTSTPLRFPADRLAEIVEEAQRRTLPEEEFDKVIPLEEIRKRL